MARHAARRRSRLHRRPRPCGGALDHRRPSCEIAVRPRCGRRDRRARGRRCSVGFLGHVVHTPGGARLAELGSRKPGAVGSQRSVHLGRPVRGHRVSTFGDDGLEDLWPRPRAVLARVHARRVHRRSLVRGSLVRRHERTGGRAASARGSGAAGGAQPEAVGRAEGGGQGPRRGSARRGRDAGCGRRAFARNRVRFRRWRRARSGRDLARYPVSRVELRARSRTRGTCGRTRGLSGGRRALSQPLGAILPGLRGATSRRACRRSSRRSVLCGSRCLQASVRGREADYPRGELPVRGRARTGVVVPATWGIPLHGAAAPVPGAGRWSTSWSRRAPATASTSPER